MVAGRGWSSELHGRGLYWYSIASTSPLQGMVFGGKKRWVPPRNYTNLFTSSSERLLEEAEWTLPSPATPHPFLSLRRVWLWVANSSVVKSCGAAGNQALAQWKGQKQQCWPGTQPWETKQMILLSGDFQGTVIFFHCLRPAGQGEPTAGSREYLRSCLCLAKPHGAAGSVHHLVLIPAATKNYMEGVNICLCV